MVYEGVLLFGVASVVGFVLLLATGWSYPLSFTQRSALQAALVSAIGAYFVVCWSRGGQTLALKAWDLSVVDELNKPPGVTRAIYRYLASWTLWLPGIIAANVIDTGVAARLAVVLGGFALMLLPAWLDRDRRLLHDRLTATRVVRISEKGLDRRQKDGG